MTKHSYSFAIQIFNQNSGILRLSEALKRGIPKHILYSMLSDAIILREDRGLYRLAGDYQPSNPDLVKISLLVPKGIVCLLTALYFFDLTTQIPPAVSIALPRNIRVPRILYPPIDVVRLSPIPYSTGVEEQFVDGVKIRIYSPEKTIVDCFKFRTKIGEEVAIEALKDYMKKYRLKIDKIIEYARIDRVEKLIRPYLETLI
jgi:predicted transcriptional regulator of viral defense system